FFVKTILETVENLLKGFMVCPMLSEIEQTAVDRIVEILRPRTCDLSHSPYAHEFQCQGLTQFLTTDGVGTKVRLCAEFNKWDTIGIDLVAMNVNDIICRRGVPYMFTNCISVESPNPDREAEIARGILAGAEEACLGLSGGEYAVMPSV